MHDILFMSAVSASVTHEMRNVLAIIKESGALADDILALNGPPRMKHGDKLTAALSTLQEQVERGRVLMLMLNDFTHSAADLSGNCDLARCARQIAPLATRMAALRGCTLTLDPASAPLPVQGNAVLILQSIHLALADVLPLCNGSEPLRLSTGERAGHGRTAPVFARISEPGNNAVFSQSAELDELMAGLGAVCQNEPGALTLLYPPAPEGALLP